MIGALRLRVRRRAAGVCLGLMLVLACAAVPPARAQAGPEAAAAPGAEAEMPLLIDPRERFERPPPGSIRAIRFLTEDDYPPFNFLDDAGEFRGFNIDLARMICEELAVPCTLQARRWDTIRAALLEEASGDAIIASVAIDAAARARMEFSRPYYRTPARFLGARGLLAGPMDARRLAGMRVGVVARSAHQAYLATFFPESRPEAFDELAAALTALRAGRLDAVFADGVALALSLADPALSACCALLPGAHYESRFFGEGVGVAFRRDEEGRRLRQGVDYALSRIMRDGRLRRLYLKHFPRGFY
jgi:polar amino acid transport system substrate-binding protein